MNTPYIVFFLAGLMLLVGHTTAQTCDQADHGARPAESFRAALSRPGGHHSDNRNDTRSDTRSDTCSDTRNESRSDTRSDTCSDTRIRQQGVSSLRTHSCLFLLGAIFSLAFIKQL
ncbi:hypothetical protein ACOMHN_054186 [Nucella lapillus]